MIILLQKIPSTLILIVFSPIIMNMTNLNKYIAQSGLCSRRGADVLIKQKQVKINDKIASPIDKVNTGDKVYVNNKLVKPVDKKVYLAFNKPFGVICTTDKNSKNTIMDYIKTTDRVFPVGRLDVKSEGLILLTNDGELMNFILKSKKVEKEYCVSVQKDLTDTFLEKLRTGIRIDGRITLPAKVTIINNKTFRIIIREGRKRQIRRMCEKNNYEVLKLKRVRIGKIKLRDIKVGKYIEISENLIYNMLDIK
jgi:23S rRNA pseudouridine2604 synthase